MAALPALLVFLLLHGVFFHDVVVGDRSLSASTYTAGLTPHGPIEGPAERGVPHLLDVEGAAWVDEPSPYLARQAFDAGELPLWNPGTGLGAPLAANLNSGAGNPLQLPLNLAPTAARADAFYLTRLLLLALATWAFLRALMLESAAACVGAIIVAYGGYAMAWIAHHPLSTELFLPVMLLGYERGRRGQTIGWIVLALAGAGSLLGGKLQASLLCFAFTALYAARRATVRQGGRGVPSVLAVAGGLVLACLAAGYLMLPAAELLRHSSGLTLGGRSQLAGFTIPWPSLASLAVPTLFAAPGQAFADGALLTPGIGVVAVALAAVGVAATGAPELGVARFCGLWALAFMLRNAGAFGDLAARVPIARDILFVKYTFTVVFALAVAAAIGFDALRAGRIAGARALRAVLLAIATIAAFGASAVAWPALPTHPAAAAVPAVLALIVAAAMILTRTRRGSRAAAAALAIALVAELRWMAPHHHPPRLDPYRPPPFVAYLRDATPGRIVADGDLLVPLTSAAAGLRDVRAIDVLTPGDAYAFFTRLVSFCNRLIHFTVDPDVTLAATAPALDLAGVRYVVTREPLGSGDDVTARVQRQVGRERTARLFAGMRRFATTGAPLAIGPIAVGDDRRFALTFTTPFTLDVTAETEAPDLAWAALVRGDTAAVRLRISIEGAPADVPDVPLRLEPGDRWQDRHVALGNAGTARPVRVRLVGTTEDGRVATVSLGDLGFGPGAAAEARLGRERAARHRDELPQLARVFHDPSFGVDVYENRNVLPRAFRVGRVEPVASLDAALTRLGDGFDFRAAALVPKSEVAALTAALDGATSAGETQIRGDTPNGVTIATTGATAALVVLADLAYPGWQATVDERTAAIVTADGLLRGVLVPAGAHVVAFRYRPDSLLVGAALSALGALLLWPYARWAVRVTRA